MQTKKLSPELEKKFVEQTYPVAYSVKGVTFQDAIDWLRETHGIIVESPKLHRGGEWSCIIKSIAADVSTYIGFTKHQKTYYDAYTEGINKALMFI